MSRTEGRKRLLRFVLPLFGVGALAVAGRAIHGLRADVDGEIAAIVAAGAPVYSDAIQHPPTDGDGWWSSLGPEPYPVEALGLSDPSRVAQLLAGPDDGFAPLERELLESLQALYVDRSDTRGRVDELWFDATILPWDPSDYEAIPLAEAVIVRRIKLVCRGHNLQLASTACSGSRFDGAAWLERWRASGEPETLPAPELGMELLLVQESLADQAVLAALDGDVEQALESLRLSWCASDVLCGAAGQYYYMVWCAQREVAWRAFIRVADRLPDAPLDEFERWLTGASHGAQLVRAIECERAILHEGVFGRWRMEDGAPSRFDGWRGYRPRAVWETYDRLVFLRAFQRMIDAAGDQGVPLPIFQADFDAWLAGHRWAVKTRLLLSSLGPLVERARRLDAQDTLGRALLLARREGLDAAKSWVETQIDPASGEPYGTRLESDGLVMWFAGADGDGDPLVLMVPSRDR